MTFRNNLNEKQIKIKPNQSSYSTSIKLKITKYKTSSNYTHNLKNRSVKKACITYFKNQALSAYKSSPFRSPLLTKKVLCKRGKFYKYASVSSSRKPIKSGEEEKNRIGTERGAPKLTNVPHQTAQHGGSMHYFYILPFISEL